MGGRGEGQTGNIAINFPFESSALVFMFGRSRQAFGYRADTNSMLLIALHVQNGKANLLLICYNCAHTSLFFLQLLLLLTLLLFMYVVGVLFALLAESVLVSFHFFDKPPAATHKKKTFPM